MHFTNGMVPLASPVPTVVTIHDMSLTLYPRYHPPRRVLLNRPLVDLAARRADAIITVSQSAKRDIVRLYGLRPSACTSSTRRRRRRSAACTISIELERVRRRYGLADRVHPLRRHDRAAEEPAEADRGVRASGGSRGDLPHQLVCAGPYGWLSRDIEDRIERLQVEDAIRFTGYVPFEDLPALYSLAEMFVFPSIYEGFGLPVIEAMACGTPVITGRRPALAEVGGRRGRARRSRSSRRRSARRWSRLARSRERREHLSALGLQRSRDVLVGARRARDARGLPPDVARAARHGTRAAMRTRPSRRPVGRPHVAAEPRARRAPSEPRAP